MANTLDLPENRTQALQVLQLEPHDLLRESKRSLEILIRLYYMRHGFVTSDAFMVQYLSLVAFSTYTSIRADMESSSLEALRSTIVLVAMALRDQSHSHYLGQLVFNAVRSGMGVAEIDLIDRFTGQGRRVGKHPPKDWQTQSIWVLDFGSIADEVEKRRLENFSKSAGDCPADLIEGAEG